MMIYRCFVTGHSGEGNSTVVKDAPVSQSTGWMFNFWSTAEAPADNAEPAVFPSSEMSLSPPPGGTLFRVFHIPPDSSIANLTKEQVREMSARIGAPCLEDRFHTDKKIWHRTDTIDYVIVVQGFPILHLEDRDIALKPLDVVVQRGTMHAWSNPAEETAVLACTLVDAKPIDNPGRRA